MEILLLFLDSSDNTFVYFPPGPELPLTNHIIKITRPMAGRRGITRLKIPPITMRTTARTTITPKNAKSFQYHLFKS